MQERIQHPIYGEIIYNESVWTGKKELSVGGQFAPSISKKTFVVNGQPAMIEGSFLTGAKLRINNDVIQICAKPKWYEVALAVLPFVFLMVWGNSPALCMVFPVVGGAIGGALGGVAAVVSLLFTKKTNSAIKKLLIALGVFAVTILAAFVLALLLLQILV